jgi:hypothetical protein
MNKRSPKNKVDEEYIFGQLGGEDDTALPKTEKTNE